MSESRAGRCYELASKRLLDDDLGATLVHGYPTLAAGPNKGQRYGHAWLEWSAPIPPIPAAVLAAHPEMKLLEGYRVTTCWDPVTDAEVPAALYYQAGRICPDLCSRYTLAEALDLMNAHGIWGPWSEPPADALFGG